MANRLVTCIIGFIAAIFIVMLMEFIGETDNKNGCNSNVSGKAPNEFVNISVNCGTGGNLVRFGTIEIGEIISTRAIP